MSERRTVANINFDSTLDYYYARLSNSPEPWGNNGKCTACGFIPEADHRNGVFLRHFDGFHALKSAPLPYYSPDA